MVIIFIPHESVTQFNLANKGCKAKTKGKFQGQIKEKRNALLEIRPILE